MLHILTSDIFLNLLVAMGLGMVLGLERFVAHKTAGLRTYTLIAMGSALFVTISQIVAAQFAGTANFDPLRIAAQVVAAAGFLGVGAIFHNDQRVSGITTASGLWVAAGIGMAAGFGLRELAAIVTILVLFTFIVLWFIESLIRNMAIRKNKGLDEDALS